ncbi:MAG TPA: AbrB/MazE/SpoVT family DNA-binding domain-containing protein [Edaphobacter sp.]|nr:AbrB/MazE/SpoVT family DNA-binding domain-containing protein [Edaphobacter sp.]
MERAIMTVSTKGQLVIPAEMRETLDIKAGSRVALTLDDGVIVLRPVTEQLVDETCGMLAGGPSMADELQRERRSERW